MVFKFTFEFKELCKLCAYIFVATSSLWLLSNRPCFIHSLFCEQYSTPKPSEVRFMFFAVWPTCWPHPSAASLLSSLWAPLIGSPSASVKAGVGGIQTIHSCSLRCGRNVKADQDPGRQQSGRGSIHSVHRRTRLCQRDSDGKPNLSPPRLLFIQKNFQFVF